VDTPGAGGSPVGGRAAAAGTPEGGTASAEDTPGVGIPREGDRTAVVDTVVAAGIAVAVAGLGGRAGCWAGLGMRRGCSHLAWVCTGCRAWACLGAGRGKGGARGPQRTGWLG